MIEVKKIKSMGKWKFYFEDKGMDGENSIVIDVEDDNHAYAKAYEELGPQVNDMVCSKIDEFH